MSTGPVTMKKTRNGMKKGKPNVTRSVSDALKKLKNRRASQENLDNAGLENGSKKIQDTTILENLGIPAEVL